MSGAWPPMPGSSPIAAASRVAAAKDPAWKHAAAPSPMTRQSSVPAVSPNSRAVITSSMAPILPRGRVRG